MSNMSFADELHQQRWDDHRYYHHSRINQASHEYKESVKVGYNLQRKVVLLSIWFVVPFVLWLKPSFFGFFSDAEVARGMLYNTSVLWLFVGIGAVVFRTVQLFFVKDVQSGLVWASKILTDPFHDIKIYYKAPYYIAKGQMYDDMTEWYAPHPTQAA